MTIGSVYLSHSSDDVVPVSSQYGQSTASSRRVFSGAGSGG